MKAKLAVYSIPLSLLLSLASNSHAASSSGELLCKYKPDLEVECEIAQNGRDKKYYYRSVCTLEACDLISETVTQMCPGNLLPPALCIPRFEIPINERPTMVNAYMGPYDTQDQAAEACAANGLKECADSGLVCRDQIKSASCQKLPKTHQY